jgi:heme ABC exporter ATP-binding subunit CcmA
MDSVTTQPPAVETQSLSKSFGNFKALRGVDLSVPAGGTLAVFGPNGAGKTTLIKILASIMRPTSGKIMIDGLELADNAEKLRARIGLVAHQSYLYGNLSAEENLDFYARMYGVTDRPKRISAVLELVGLAPRRHDRFSTFSRGMQQRMALARALLHKPSVLLLDEPETGLDQQGLDALWGIIRREEAGRRTIVFTSHNFERALGVCDSVVIMERGRIAFREQACNLNLDILRQKYSECAQAGKK